MRRNFAAFALASILLFGSTRSASQDLPQEIGEELTRFEQQFAGWSFVRNMPDAARVETIAISQDAQVVKTIIKVVRDGITFRDASYGSGELGLIFFTKDRDPPEPKMESSAGTPHRVEFIETEDLIAKNSLLNIPLYGRLYGNRLNDYVKSCTVEIGKQQVKGEDLTDIVCDHPTLPSVTFKLGPDRHIRYIEQRIRPGDSLPSGEVVPNGVNTTIIIGPIEYDALSEKLIVVSAKTLVKANGVKPVEVYSTFEKYVPTEEPMSKLIDLPEFKIQNGDEVVNNKRTSVRHEYLNGNVVIVVDDQSISAANNARFQRSGYARSRYYLILGTLSLLFIGIMVWRRNGKHAN